MIIADEMERTVDDQVRCMIRQRNALLRRLARAGFARQHDIAEQYLSPPGFFGVAVGQAGEQVGLHLREREDVGGPVLAAKVAVERSEEQPSKFKSLKGNS